MILPTLFDLCEPRRDVLLGTIAEADFAADLAQVLRGDAPEEYRDPVKFFANTHPTRGLKDLLRGVCLRLQGHPDQIAAILRMATKYGGGKTHCLIALVHSLNGGAQIPNIAEFIDPALLPPGKVRIAAFDGENADPLNGHLLEPGLRAYTPWGEIAYALAGRAGYEKVRRSDEAGGAPGADTLRELFGDEPTLILMDELSVYLRKLKISDRATAGGQLTAFLTALFKAVEGTPNAVVVYTLAIGKGGLATDAYSDENQFIADKMEEAESVSARKATLLDPTEEDETVKILRRRLFTRIDDDRAAAVLDAYRQLWYQHKDLLP
jgi:predicted AAA+ superfamily ATPase